MRVELLYIDDCPNWKLADQHLRHALAAVGSTIEIERGRVSTTDEAERWGFHGSPSVLVDGTDPFAAEGASVGLSCRLYRTAEGTSGSPTVAELVRVLTPR